MTEVPESAMEVRVRRALDKRKVRYWSQMAFCLQTIVPDIHILDKEICIFLDGPVHKGRQERDQELREKLAKRYHVKVLSIPYKRNTAKEFRRIMAEIEEQL